MTLPSTSDLLAPDGSEVRILLSVPGGSMAHFLLQSGQVSRAVRHRTVDEIWYILSGQGEMWRSDPSQSPKGETTPLAAGTCLTIRVGTAFQFRATGAGPLTAVAVTIPPWPGETEAEFVDGKWPPSV
jgi:mannose-6-phosphate isomerase-like protein (cupin superfamily)